MPYPIDSDCLREQFPVAPVINQTGTRRDLRWIVATTQPISADVTKARVLAYRLKRITYVRAE